MPTLTCPRRVFPATVFGALWLLGLAGAAPALADDGESPAVTPYRPSVSTPAALSAPGWVEIEAGLQRSRGHEPARRDSLPWTAKLAFSEDWGVRLGGDAWLAERQPGAPGSSGGGDTSIVLKRRFAVDDASAFGLEAGVKAPTARRGLSSGDTDLGLNAIYSSDFGVGWHADLNLLATRLGGAEAGQGRTETGWALAVSRSLNDQFSAVGEVSGTRQRGADRTCQALGALSYSPSRSLTLDLGLSKGLSTASGGWSVFSGLTFLAARWF